MTTLCAVALGVGGAWPGQTFATAARARIGRTHILRDVSVRQVMLMADVTLGQRMAKRQFYAERLPGGKAKLFDTSISRSPLPSYSSEKVLCGRKNPWKPRGLDGTFLYLVSASDEFRLHLLNLLSGKSA